MNGFFTSLTFLSTPYLFKNQLFTIKHKGGEKMKKQVIKNKTKIFIHLLLIILCLVFTFGVSNVSAADDTIYTNDSENLTVSDVQTTFNSSNSTIHNSSGSETNQTLPDPVIYNGGVQVSRGGQAAGYNWGTIQNAINAALDGDTIMLENGATFSGTGNTNIYISKNLTFDVLGGGIATIDGSGTNWGFEINSGYSVTFNHIIFQNLINSFGGAIYNKGTLNITNSTFTNNTANPVGGGAIYNEGTLNVTDSTFTENLAFLGGGGAIYNYYGNCTVNNCVFTNNHDPVCLIVFDVPISGWGGAIRNEKGALNVTESTFTSNSAEGSYGGAISNEGTMTVTRSTFISNMARVIGGGAIYNEGALNVTESTFTSNRAHAANYGYSMEWNSDGGAIYNKGTLNATGSTFTWNYADGMYSKLYIPYLFGGTIYNSGGDATIKFNYIIGNSLHEISNYDPNLNYGSVDASLNWWGSNSQPAAIAGFGGIIDPWIVLTVAADPTTIDNRGNSQITADLLHDSNGVYHAPALGHVPDTAITLTVPWGSFFNPGTTHSVTVNTVNGAITPITFYANEGAVNPLYNPVKVSASANGYTTNTESAFININKLTNLVITKTGPATVNAGNTITYTINVTNNGIDSADDVSIQDTFPTDVSSINWSAVYAGGAIGPASGSGNLNLNLGTLPVGGSCTITATGTVLSSTPSGTISNTATVTTTTLETTATDNSATAITTVNTQADLSVSKNGPETVFAGNPIIYTITVTNNGPSDARDVRVQDDLPDTIVDREYRINDGTWTSLTGNLDQIISYIAHDDSVTLEVRGRIPSSIPASSISNTASTSVYGATFDSNTIKTAIITSADIDLNKTVDKSRPDVGDTVTFTVTAHNGGPSDATNIQVSDLMPSEFADVKVTPSKGTYVGDIWTFDLASGEETTLILSGKVTAIMAGKNTTNTATKLNQTESDPNTFDTASASIYVPKSDLYIQITSNKNKPKAGEIFTIAYKLGNNGPDAAENVSITITLPKGFEYTHIHGDGNWTYDETTRIITWTFTSVPVGDPYIYISGNVLKPGKYIFGSSISSKTYINSPYVTPITINALTKVKAVNSTTKTIKMQPTGIPIVGLILAILSIFGGLIISRKK